MDIELKMACPYCAAQVSNQSNSEKIYCSECGQVIYIGLFKDSNINRLLSASEVQFWEYKQLHSLYGAERKTNLDDLILTVANGDFAENVFPLVNERRLLWEIRYGQDNAGNVDSKDSMFKLFTKKKSTVDGGATNGVSELVFVDKGLRILQNLILYSKQPSWNNKRLARKELTKLLMVLNQQFAGLNEQKANNLTKQPITFIDNKQKSSDEQSMSLSSPFQSNPKNIIDKNQVIPTQLNGQAKFVLRQEIVSLIFLYINLCLKSKHYTALVFGLGKRKSISTMNKIWDDLLLLKEIYLEPNEDQEILFLCGEAIVEALNLHQAEYPDRYRD